MALIKKKDTKLKEGTTGERMLALHQFAVDRATGEKGMLIFLQIYPNGNRTYAFQPKRLSPETGRPVDCRWITSDRIEPVKKGGSLKRAPLPAAVNRAAFGSEVEDVATGLKGEATSYIIHPNGCVHVEVQPKGVNPRTGATFGSDNFDYRRAKGRHFTPMTDDERVKSEKAGNLSPDEIPPHAAPSSFL